MDNKIDETLKFQLDSFINIFGLCKPKFFLFQRTVPLTVWVGKQKENIVSYISIYLYN